MINSIDKYIKLIEAEAMSIKFGGNPTELYEPIRYIMTLGGKRMRPLLTLLSYSLFKDDIKSIVRQALAIEVFHNFTLMHDDIMDEAPLRRGNPTVHKKWNHNTAILSGDVMLVKAYELLMSSNGYSTEVISKFNKCATEVCEGQQMDMIFETKKTVGVNDYVDMIRLKTAVLLGFSLELGAILAETTDTNKKALYDFGANIGIGFQLKDDLLDVYADKKKFGKQVGGDILSNKKTFLLITALNKAKGKTKKELQGWLIKENVKGPEKIKAVTKIYDQLGIKEQTEEKMAEFFNEGFKALKKIDAPLPRKAALKAFAESLISREK